MRFLTGIRSSVSSDPARRRRSKRGGRVGSTRPLVTLSGTQMNDLTICILSAVEPPLPECVESARVILSSDPDIGGIVYVKNIFPMSAAFNAMVERCDSRFIVQVDG